MGLFCLLAQLVLMFHQSSHFFVNLRPPRLKDEDLLAGYLVDGKHSVLLALRISSIYWSGVYTLSTFRKTRFIDPKSRNTVKMNVTLLGNSV